MPGGYVQEKFESTPGNEHNTPTLSTKIIYPPGIEYDWESNTAPMERNDELRASQEPQAVVKEHYEPEWSAEGRMYPDYVGWRLKHILGPPVTTAGDGIITDPDTETIPATAYRHVWTSTHANWGNAGASPMTTQMILAYVDQGLYVKLKGAACASLTINTPDQGGARLLANGPALYHDDALANPSLTATPESIATLPFKRSGLTLPTWLSGSGTAIEDFGVTITNPVQATRTVGGASAWPTIMEKAEGLITVGFSLAHRQLDPDDLAALRESTGFPIKARWLSETDIAATSYKHTLWLEGVNAQYTEGSPGALANVRRIGADFSGMLTTAGSGVACTITLVNGTASYA